MNAHIHQSSNNMSASRQQFQDSDSDTSYAPPTPTEGTTYVHNVDKRRHTRNDPRKRHANTIYPPNNDVLVNEEGDGINYEPIHKEFNEVSDNNAINAIENMENIFRSDGSSHIFDREGVTGTPMSDFTDPLLSVYGPGPWTYALNIISTIPWMVRFIAAQRPGEQIKDAVQNMHSGFFGPNDFDNIIDEAIRNTTCKTIYPSCTHIKIHSSLIPPLQHLSKLVRDTNEIYFHLLNTITGESENNSRIIPELYSGQDSFIIHMSVTANISHGQSLGCEDSPRSHILTECMLKTTCNTLPIILNVSIQRNDVENLTLPTDVDHTTPKKQKIIFDETLTLTSNNHTSTYTLVALVMRNDEENNQEHLQIIGKRQDQWVMFNNDQATLPITTNIFQNENIQQQVTLLVYEVNDALNITSSIHSKDNSHPEEGDVKDRHLLAANVLADLNQNTDKETGELQNQNDDRPAKKRRNIIPTSTRQSPMPSQAKNILFTTTKPTNNDTDSLLSLDMSVPANKEKAAFIRSNIPKQYWTENTEKNHVIFHFGDEIIPVAIHMWDEEKAKRDEAKTDKTTDIPELMEKYIHVMLIR